MASRSERWPHRCPIDENRTPVLAHVKATYPEPARMLTKNPPIMIRVITCLAAWVRNHPMHGWVIHRGWRRSRERSANRLNWFAWAIMGLRQMNDAVTRYRVVEQ